MEPEPTKTESKEEEAKVAPFVLTPGFTYVSAVIDKLGTEVVGRIKGELASFHPYREFQVYEPARAKIHNCSGQFIRKLPQIEVNRYFVDQFRRLARVRISLERKLCCDSIQFKPLFIARAKAIQIFNCQCKKSNAGDFALKCDRCFHIICWECGACRCCKPTYDE